MELINLFCSTSFYHLTLYMFWFSTASICICLHRHCLVSASPITTSTIETNTEHGDFQSIAANFDPISNSSRLAKACSAIADDCNQIYYAYCDHNSSQCVCNLGFHAVKGTCIKTIVPGDFSVLSQLVKQSPFIPVLFVLGVMFACLCLVLHLFSKARFRNQNRSIFVNPQILKVAQAQERRLSQLSQLSANALRTPRTTPNRSPNSSNRSARSSYGSNVVYSSSGPNEQPATISIANHLYAPDSVLLKAKSRSNSISSSKLLS